MYPLLILTSDITSPQAPKACSGSRVLASSTRQSSVDRKEPGGLREILEEDEEKKGHPILPQQATRKNVQEGDEQMYHPLLPQQEATRGLSGYQHNTSQAISVRKDKRKPLKRRHQMMSTIQSKPNRFCQK